MTLAGESWAIQPLSQLGDVTFLALASIDQAAAGQTQAALRGLAWVGLGAMGLAVLGSVWLARTLTQPIDQLSQSLVGDDDGRSRAVTRCRCRARSRELDQLTTTFNSLLASVASAEAEAEATYLGAVRALAAALDARDPYTAGHSERVSTFAVAIGEELKLDADAMETLRLGALLHDIGKIGVPDEVLRKSSALTAAEFETIKTHPIGRRAHPAQHSVPRAAHSDRRAASRAPRRPRLSVRLARRRDSAGRAHRPRRRRVRRHDQRARVSLRPHSRRSDRRAAPLRRHRLRRPVGRGADCRVAAAGRRRASLSIPTVFQWAARARAPPSSRASPLAAVVIAARRGRARRRRGSRWTPSRRRTSITARRSCASRRRGSICSAPFASPTTSICACGRSSSADRSMARGRRRCTSWRCATSGPGAIGLRVDAGQFTSPIGLSLLENRPDKNPVVSQHSTLYLPIPRYEPGTPSTNLLAAAYPLGAKVTVSGAKWDARAAVIDSSPVRGRPFFGDNKPPRMANVVAGVGVTPYIGLRFGVAVGSGRLCRRERGARPVARRSSRDAGAGRRRVGVSATRALPASFSGPSASWRPPTRRVDGGWIEITQTIHPRVFVAARYDDQWTEWTSVPDNAEPPRALSPRRNGRRIPLSRRK